MSTFAPRHLAVLVGAVLVTALGVAPSVAADRANAVLKAPDGGTVGTVALEETPHGVLLAVHFDKAPPGTHAFHIHAVGTCTTPDFKSAGGHYAPHGHAHGIRVAEGKHAGDLPNVHVAADGTLDIEILADAVSLADGTDRAPLFDADGSAIVMHADGDDYTSQPSGAAGGRIACGVIEPAN